MSSDIFASKPNKISKDITSYNFLLFSEPGVGKTTFAVGMFPDRHLLLGAECGYKGIVGARGVPVPDYITLNQIVSQLDTDEARAEFDTIIIDTTTKIGEMIENYILSIYGKNTIGECMTRGGAYPLINRYYNLAFDRVKARGYNFVYICHAQRNDIKAIVDGQEVIVGEKWTPKMSDRIKNLIAPEVDYTFFITQNQQGERILVTDKTVKNDGKQRTNLPLIMSLDANKFREEFVKGVVEKGGDMTTDERQVTTVVGYKREQRDYKVVIEEIKALGKKLMTEDSEKGKQALAILNNKLGKDDNGIQRTLELCTQENVEMLELMLIEMSGVA